MVFSTHCIYSRQRQHLSAARIEVSPMCCFFTFCIWVGRLPSTSNPYNGEPHPLVIRSRRRRLKQYRSGQTAVRDWHDPWNWGPPDSICCLTRNRYRSVLLKTSPSSGQRQLRAYDKMPIIYRHQGASISLWVATSAPFRPMKTICTGLMMKIGFAGSVYKVWWGVKVTNNRYKWRANYSNKHKIKSSKVSRKRTMMDRPKKATTTPFRSMGGIHFEDGSMDNGSANHRSKIIIADSAVTGCSIAVYGTQFVMQQIRRLKTLDPIQDLARLPVRGGNHRCDYCTFTTTSNQDESLTISNFIAPIPYVRSWHWCTI